MGVEWDKGHVISGLTESDFGEIARVYTQLYEIECNSDLYCQNLKIKKSFRQLLICISL